ncbi:MAG: zinc ribbon domain-containing protein [Chloroflexota bacterium]|nr:zinc ribbon domain-containing protein [Chloroflexota bacterium]
MSDETIECFNCGHANPSWAQVCRQCGFALGPSGGSSGGPRGIFPTDQASLISIGGTLGAIVLAIALGLFFAGLLPPAANVAFETPSPSPSPTPLPSISVAPSVAASASASASAAPVLPGTITFGTGLNNDTKEVTGPTTTFVAGTGFAHSIKLTQTFAVNSIEEEITRLADGVVVQARGPNGTLRVTPSATTAGFKAGVTTTELIAGWGKGEFVMRVYRGADLLAEGHFTLS